MRNERSYWINGNWKNEKQGGNFKEQYLNIVLH